MPATDATIGYAEDRKHLLDYSLLTRVEVHFPSVLGAAPNGGTRRTG